MEFTELKCPVCGLQFTENDDVVVCPDCGTAHHRACWQTLGHCACADSHGAEIPSQTVPHDDAPAEPETRTARRVVPHLTGFRAEEEKAGVFDEQTKYRQTLRFIEQMARERLNLVFPGEVIIKPED